MSQSTTRNLSVETPTEYESSLECDHPIRLQLSGLSKNQTVYVAQQLSLFLEIPKRKTIVNAIDVAGGADAVNVLTEADTETVNVAWPLVLEIEDVAEPVAEALKMKFEKTISEQTGELITELATLLKVATKDGQRSVVRMEQRDGSARPNLEWHTDTGVRRRHDK